MNSGATRPMAHPRGESTFKSLADYPLAERRGRGRVGAVGEVLVADAVYDIAKFVRRVERFNGEHREHVVWSTGDPLG
jgi:hypothetical protein